MRIEKFNTRRNICYADVNFPLIINSHLNGHQFFHSSANLQDEFIEQEKTFKAEKQKARDNADFEEGMKKDLLNAALEEVLEYGWTQEAINVAASKKGFPSVISGLFERGGADLVLHHISRSNRVLDDWMKEEVEKYRSGGSGKVPVGKFVRSAIMRRLRMNSVFLLSGERKGGDRWSEGVALLASPTLAPACLDLMQELCDDIWWRAGDTSTDFNWYTKRISLAAIYSATELFMLQDKSPNFQETEQFLDRRLQDLQGFPQLAKIPGDVTVALNSLLLTTRGMAGIQK